MTHARFVPTIAQLWSTARQWCAEALAALRGPVAVADAIVRDAYLAARRRIERIEAFVLKLMLIEAAAAPPRRHAPQAVRRLRRQPSTPHTEDPNDPSTWRVRFDPRLARMKPRPIPRGAAPLLLTPRPGRAHAKARALARRFEALVRVVTNPQRAVAALARKLHALGARARPIALHIAHSTPCEGGGRIFGHATVFALRTVGHWPRDTS